MTAETRRFRTDREAAGIDVPGDRRTDSVGSKIAWPRLGIAALLGLIAGATLFATPAQGCTNARRHRE